MLNFHQNKVNWFNLDRVEKGTGEEGVEHDKLRNWQVNQPIFRQNKHWHDRVPERHWKDVDNFFSEYGEHIMTKLGYV